MSKFVFSCLSKRKKPPFPWLIHVHKLFKLEFLSRQSTISIQYIHCIKVTFIFVPRTDAKWCVYWRIKKKKKKLSI